MAIRSGLRLRCREGLFVVCLVPALGLTLAANPASAQQLQVWPGFRDTNGPTIEIETEDNVRCRYSQGARPSFSVAGLSANPSTSAQASSGNASSSAMVSQLGGGLLLTIPFGGSPVNSCGRLSVLQERRSKLALGAALLEQGLITQEQFQQLGASIARDLGIPAASSSDQVPRPVYEPPPPFKTGPATSATPFKPRFSPVDTGSGAASSPAASGGRPGGAIK
jgi:hypothetical protein